MGKVYFISDLHIGHTRLINNLRKMDSDYHDNLIISNWNSVVTKYDTVFVLGDITFENIKDNLELISKLRGNKTLIGGNHDTEYGCSELIKLGWRVIGCKRYKGFFLSHIPIHPSEFDFNPNIKGNIHGHIHEKELNDSRYINVSCEKIRYTPISFEKIKEKFGY